MSDSCFTMDDRPTTDLMEMPPATKRQAGRFENFYVGLVLKVIDIHDAQKLLVNRN